MGEVPWPASETDAGFLSWHVNGDDVVGCEHEQLLGVCGLLAHAADGVLEVDALELVGHEACVAPCLGVTCLVGEGEQAGILLPGFRGEAVVVVLHAAAGDLE